MNSFEIQSESEAQAERQRSLNLQAKTSTYATGSIMSHFSSLVPPPAPPPPPPSLSTNSLSSQTRSKTQTDSRRFLEPLTGTLINIIEDHKYAVFISCIEIYNNYIYDLLDDSPDASK